MKPCSPEPLTPAKWYPPSPGGNKTYQPFPCSPCPISRLSSLISSSVTAALQLLKTNFPSHHCIAYEHEQLTSKLCTNQMLEQLKGYVKEPNMFHDYETEKITRKAAEYIELFGSSARDRHAGCI